MSMNEETAERATKAKRGPTGMSVTVAKRDLARLAARMAGVAEKKSTMPILRTVLLTAEGRNVTLCATDLYLSLKGSVPVADIDAPGGIAVAASDLVDRVKMLPDGPVTLEVKDNSLTLKAKGVARRFTLRGLPSEDYPVLPTAGEAPTMTLPTKLLRKLIARTHFAVSTDETRPHLNSGLLEWEGDLVRMVATDGHRLALAEAKVPGMKASTSMLIPLKAIHELARLCDEADVPVVEGEEAREPEIVIAQSGSTAFFRSGAVTFGVKLIDAQFPPYRQVIPKDSSRSAKVPRATFADAVRAVAVAASATTNGVKLVLTKGLMRLSSESADSGDGSDEVPVTYDGASLTIGFAWRYVTDALGAVSDDEMDIGFGNELDPIVVTSGTPEDSYLAVIMPLRI